MSERLGQFQGPDEERVPKWDFLLERVFTFSTEGVPFNMLKP